MDNDNKVYSVVTLLIAYDPEETDPVHWDWSEMLDKKALMISSADFIDRGILDGFTKENI